MSGRWILVDGYNVLHAWPRLRKLAGRSLDRQRQALIRVLAQYADQSGHRVTVVWDGYEAKHPPTPAEPAPTGTEIVFSESGKTADDVIERCVSQAAQPGQIQVVTSDRVEQDTVTSLGAQSLSAELSELEVNAALTELERLVRAHTRRRRAGVVGDFFEG